MVNILKLSSQKIFFIVFHIFLSINWVIWLLGNLGKIIIIFEGL